MSDGFLSVKVVNERKLLKDIEDIPSVVRDVLAVKIREWTTLMKDTAVENILSRLKQKTGLLASSVKMEVTEEGLRVDGEVWIAGVPYARAQEKGAQTKAHIIHAKNAKALAFIAASGDKVFALWVLNPGAKIPAHYFMRDAYRFVSPKVTRGLRYYIVERLRNKGSFS